MCAYLFSLERLVNSRHFLGHDLDIMQSAISNGACVRYI